jgi:hypothetical protein
MKLIQLIEADLYYYGWIDAEGEYHEGGHGVLILDAFRDEILSDLGANPNDPASVKKALERAFENDFYEYGFNHGWVRVYTEGGEIGFQMKEARRDAIRKVAEILRSVFDYKVMLDTAYAPFQRFPDPKMALRWLNQRFRGVVTEAPLGDFQVDPDLEQNLAKQRRKWHGYERELQHFPDPDVRAIRSPSVVRKIATRFARIPQNINLYFWANPDPDYDWHTQKGEVDLDWIAHNMGKQVAQRFARMRDTKNRINIMHTGNLRDEGYVPMRSPWMMAHRIAHVLGQDHRIQNRFDQFVIDLTRKIYGVKWPDPNGQYGEIFRRDYFSAYGKILGHLLGRMKSARQEKLVQYREWIYERFAQYLMTGRVRLNRTLPRQIYRGDNRMRPGAERLIPKLIGHFEHRIEQIFEKVLNDSIGKYYVM